jgi:hypothetical protein
MMTQAECEEFLRLVTVRLAKPAEIRPAETEEERLDRLEIKLMDRKRRATPTRTADYPFGRFKVVIADQVGRGDYRYVVVDQVTLRPVQGPGGVPTPNYSAQEKEQDRLNRMKKVIF